MDLVIGFIEGFLFATALFVWLLRSTRHHRVRPLPQRSLAHLRPIKEDGSRVVVVEREAG